MPCVWLGFRRRPSSADEKRSQKRGQRDVILTLSERASRRLILTSFLDFLAGTAGSAAAAAAAFLSFLSFLLGVAATGSGAGAAFFAFFAGGGGGGAGSVASTQKQRQVSKDAVTPDGTKVRDARIGRTLLVGLLLLGIVLVIVRSGSRVGGGGVDLVVVRVGGGESGLDTLLEDTITKKVGDGG